MTAPVLRLMWKRRERDMSVGEGAKGDLAGRVGAHEGEGVVLGLVEQTTRESEETVRENGFDTVLPLDDGVHGVLQRDGRGDVAELGAEQEEDGEHHA